MSSTFLVFDSQPNFRSNSNKFQFTDCCLQSRPNRRRCQIFLFGGDAAGLSIAICYRTSTSYAPTHNLITIIKSFCDGSLLRLRFRARFLSKLPLWQISFLRMSRASRSQTWVIYHLIKSSQSCFWYRAFLLNLVKFDDIASSHFCIAPNHTHHLISIISQVHL
jgi:hypothetical protein